MPEDQVPADRNIGTLPTLAIVIGIVADICRAAVWSRGLFDGEVFGYGISGILMAGIIAYLFAGRRKVRNVNRFAWFYLSASTFFLLLELSTKWT